MFQTLTLDHFCRTLFQTCVRAFSSIIWVVIYVCARKQDVRSYMVSFRLIVLVYWVWRCSNFKTVDCNFSFSFVFSFKLFRCLRFICSIMVVLLRFDSSRLLICWRKRSISFSLRLLSFRSLTISSVSVSSSLPYFYFRLHTLHISHSLHELFLLWASIHIFRLECRSEVQDLRHFEFFWIFEKVSKLSCFWWWCVELLSVVVRRYSSSSSIFFAVRFLWS